MNHNTYNAGLRAGEKTKAVLGKGGNATSKVAVAGYSAVAGFTRGLVASKQLKKVNKRKLVNIIEA